jgi:predicted nucleic acid-binding protein
LVFIDTDALYQILDKNSKKGEEIFQKLEQSGESFAITSITLYEILYLFMRMGKDTSQIHLLRVFEFSKEDAQKAAELEIEAEKKGKKVSTTNLITAAIVMNNEGSLCALNEDFNELKNAGLKLYL